MENQSATIPVLENELWWGGVVQDGIRMPFGHIAYGRELYGELAYNQGSPLLLSNKGRYVWSEEPFTFSFEEGSLTVTGVQGSVVYGEGSGNLRSGFREVSRTFFPPSGTLPHELFFTVPQYNTWMEMAYEPTQDKVLSYAEAILSHGMPPGILMIDDNWHEDYGTLVFHKERFPDPKAMIERLHGLGFKVMLWVCPFVSPDSVIFRELRGRGYLIREADGKPAIREWWNGFSGVIDCTNKEAVDWFTSGLDWLIRDYGVDGFKLDAGDPQYYKHDDLSAMAATPNEHCEAWARLGLRYTFNEYRACWKNGGQPLVQRLSDKNHSWGVDGLASLIPNGLAQGLSGYAFNCPDMVGGGQYEDLIRPGSVIDAELFVRYAQCSALFPMMQFSTAPWRVLDEQHLAYCIDAARLHCHLGPEIAELARHAAVTGEPIMRHMAYVFPEGGFEKVNDQFMLGDEILVAPVLEQGASTRTVRFPQGTWVNDDGCRITGPCDRIVAAPLSKLPWYRRE